MWKDRRTGGGQTGSHNKPNRRFSQLLERPQKGHYSHIDAVG